MLYSLLIIYVYCMERSELVYACALNEIFSYNCAKALDLISLFPSLEDIFRLAKGELDDILGKESYYTDKILSEETLRKCEEEIEWAAKHGIRILYYSDREYPKRLKECRDAPLVLYTKGNTDLNCKRVISIVGTRKISPYGEAACRQIVENFSELEEKPLIISGLAFGVDICAHRKAMECGMETVAVIPTGLDQIYPREHREDAIRMIHNGGILTDRSRGNPPHRINFIRRNRIIAGLCDACILIESDIKGGGMITAQMAEAYDRELFALPGRISDKYSQGCNYLILENKAGIIYSPMTVINALGWKDYPKKGGNSKKMTILDNDSAIKQKILLLLADYSVIDIDTIIQTCGGDISSSLAAITELESEGRITQDLTGRYHIT